MGASQSQANGGGGATAVSPPPAHAAPKATPPPTENAVDAAAATLARIRAAEAAFQQAQEAKKPTPSQPLWQRLRGPSRSGEVVPASAAVSTIHPDSPSGPHTPLLVDPTQEPIRGARFVTEQDRIPQMMTRSKGHKTDVLPASVVGTPVPEGGMGVFTMGQPRTKEEAEQLNQTYKNRRECILREQWTLESIKYSVLIGMLGLPWAAMVPRSWPALVRYGPFAVTTMVGMYVDDTELQRKCKQNNPLPRWTIERAMPVDVMLEEKKKREAKEAPHKQMTQQELPQITK